VSKVLITESRNAPKIATQKKEVIENPGTINATISSTNAFMIRVNNPKVIIVSGIEISIRIGFIIAFTSPRISADQMIGHIPVNLSP
jgi:hypothetical protein